MYLVALKARPRGREEQSTVTWVALPFFTAAIMDLMDAGILGLADDGCAGALVRTPRVLRSGFGLNFAADFLLLLL